MRKKLSDEDREKCLICVADSIIKELKENNKIPKGEKLQEELRKLTDLTVEKKFTLTDVSRLKNDAIEKYINFSKVSVRSEVNDDLSKTLEEKFGLKKAIVINKNYIDISGISPNEYLGKKASEYLLSDLKLKPLVEIKNLLTKGTLSYIEEKITRNSLIDLPKCKDIVFSCGSTIGAAIDYLDEDFDKTNVFSSIILVTNSFKDTTPSELVHKFTHKFKGSTGITFQIPKEILMLVSQSDKTESIDSRDILAQRSFFYKNVIWPNLKKTLDAGYLVLGIGGIPDDKNPGGFNYLLETTKCLEKFSDYCVGELSYWPILREKKNIKKGETIWLWDYVRDLQKKHMEKIANVECRDQPDEEYLFYLFKKLFWQTYTLNFNELITKKNFYTDFTRRLDATIQEVPLAKRESELKKLFSMIYGKHIDIPVEKGLYKTLQEITKRKVIVPAGGDEKVPAIRQCLTYKKNFIDVLITDSSTADKIIGGASVMDS